MIGGAVAHAAPNSEPCDRYPQTAGPGRIIAQGRALVAATEALSTIEPSGPPVAAGLQAPSGAIVGARPPG
jgi:hypothetical protein